MAFWYRDKLKSHILMILLLILTKMDPRQLGGTKNTRQLGVRNTVTGGPHLTACDPVDGEQRRGCAACQVRD